MRWVTGRPCRMTCVMEWCPSCYTDGVMWSLNTQDQSPYPHFWNSQNNSEAISYEMPVRGSAYPD